MLDSVNLVQFKKAFRGSLSDMLAITEACVEKNTQVLNDRYRCYFLVKKCYINDDSFFKSCGSDSY